MTNTLTMVGRTDIGRVRSRNEDALILDPAHGVIIVADGMGGHPGGDVASAVAAERIHAALLEGHGTHDATREPGGAMSDAVLEGHHAVLRESERRPELDGMGTTVVALQIEDDGGYVLGHVGDSRAYLLRDDRLELLTRDDTWVQERLDARALTRDQARHHPLGQILTQCLGGPDTPTPHVGSGQTRPGDIYLLCSDGLVGAVGREDIHDALRGVRTDAEGVAEELVAAANAAGGRDNITVALVMVG